MPNKIITVESRPVDHVIEFNCWATSNKIANKRAIWLEKLFINSAFVFELKGAERFFWKERLSDNYMSINGQRVFSRPIRFFLRFREFDAKAYSIIRQVLIDLKILLPFPAAKITAFIRPKFLIPIFMVFIFIRYYQWFMRPFKIKFRIKIIYASLMIWFIFLRRIIMY